MSNSEPPVAKATLVADAGDQHTEIEILDGNFKPIALDYNLGSVEVELTPGVYAVRFRTGNEVKQKLAVLNKPGITQYVTLKQDEALHLDTSAPIAQTGTTRKSHPEEAQRLSLAAPLDVIKGETAGCHLFLFVRDPQATSAFEPVQGLTLHNLDGTLLLDLSLVGEHNDQEHWFGCHLNLSPGGCLLRYARMEDQVEEFIVYMCEGWQTQLFLCTRDSRSTGDVHRLDMARPSVLMAPAGRGFDPEGHDVRLTEQALLALSGGRAVPRRTKNDMLWEKYRNPMLGIYGGLLHLRRKQVNVDLMVTVFGNLMNLVGPIPDVLAIGWGAVLNDEEGHKTENIRRALREEGPIETPPMLRSSWRWLLKASAVDKKLIPEASLAEQIGTYSFVSGPWLVWQRQADSPAEEFVLGQRKSSFLGTIVKGFLSRLVGEEKLSNFVKNLARYGLDVLLPRLVRLFMKDPEAAYLICSDRYSDLERRVARYVYPPADPTIQLMLQGNPELEKRLTAGLLKRAQDSTSLVEGLQLPVGTTLRVVWALLGKLQNRPILPAEKHLNLFLRKETHEDKVLRRVLTKLKKQDTILRHMRSGTPINRLQFLYLRYRNSPSAAGKASPTAKELAALLNENEYVSGAAARQITERTIGRVLRKVRHDVIAALEKAAKTNRLNVDETWIGEALPSPNRFHPVKLFPLLAEKAPPEEPSGQ